MHAYAIYTDDSGVLLHGEESSSSPARIVRSLEESVPTGMSVAGIVFTDEERALQIVDRL